MRLPFEELDFSQCIIRNQAYLVNAHFLRKIAHFNARHALATTRALDQFS